MNWGRSIAIVLVLFIGFIITLAVLMGQINTDLESKDYYQEGLKYDEISLIKSNYQKDPSILKIDNSNGVILFDFRGTPKGEIIFKRASDKDQDFKMKISTDEEGKQYFDTKDLTNGHWKVKVRFQVDETEYLAEQNVYL